MLSEEFEEKAAAYLAVALGVEEVEVLGATLILGGASRLTWSVDARWLDAAGTSHQQGLIFRLDPPSSLLASQRATEYAMYEAMYDVEGVPVPKPLFIEDSVSYFDMPFFVMERLDGESSPEGFLRKRFDGRREDIMRQVWAALGAIAKVDFQGLGLDRVLEAPEPSDIWSKELDRWEEVLNAHDLGPMPITRAAIRQLRRNPPPPPSRVSVVHGDFRMGNYLFTPERCVAILDWEMAHLGDPHEDVAWALLQNWRHRTAPDKVGSCLDPEEVVAVWEAASGIKLDSDTFRWWKLFNHVKANGIWMTGAHEFATGRNRTLMYATMEWALVGAQEKWILEDMGVLGA